MLPQHGRLFQAVGLAKFSSKESFIEREFADMESDALVGRIHLKG